MNSLCFAALINRFATISCHNNLKVFWTRRFKIRKNKRLRTKNHSYQSQKLKQSKRKSELENTLPTTQKIKKDIGPMIKIQPITTFYNYMLLISQIDKEEKSTKYSKSCLLLFKLERLINVEVITKKQKKNGVLFPKFC